MTISCVNNSNLKIPKTPKVPVQDNYFGRLITDDYRHLENLKDSSTINWFRAQDDYSEKYLEKLSNQRILVEQMKSYYVDEAATIYGVKYADNGFVFFLKKEKKTIYDKLFYKATPGSEAIELFDPSTFHSELNHEYTINYFQPSWDGDFILVSLSYDGIKESNLIIINVLKKTVLPEIITNAEPDSYLGISWLPDSSGFLYLYIPVLDPEDEKYMLNSSTVLHKLGSNSNKRNIIFSSSMVSSLSKKDLPIAKILSKNDRYIIGYKASVENYWLAYYAKLSDLKTGKINWQLFYDLDEKIYADYGVFLNDEFVFISGKNADNRTISSFDLNLKQPFKANILVPEKKDEVLTSLIVSNNKLYYTSSRFGVEAFLYKYKDGQETQIELPIYSGEISLYSPSNENETLQVGVDGWTNDYTRYFLKDQTFILDPLSNQKKYPEFEGLQEIEVLVASHDDEEIPLSIIHKKGINYNGSNPTLLYPYGAYGELMTPFFSPIFLTWVKNGGVLAVPHIRGGGEKGDSWHEQGMKSKKHNSWKDLIACTEYLIENKFTSKDKTVLYSSSAGGVAIGMAIVERPDLYNVFIADAPMLNPLRSEERTNNASNHLEYGTVKDSAECMALIKMDPYVNLKPNVNYPASLIISGYNDSRIDPWIPGKFVAKLQDHSTSDAPILLDVNYDAGHEGGDTIDELIEEYSKIFAFAFWHTNHNLN
ncbi:prolyl oligopeptidase family serine peptidase [Mariniflexile ostreae]